MKQEKHNDPASFYLAAYGASIVKWIPVHMTSLMNTLIVLHVMLSASEIK